MDDALTVFFRTYYEMRDSQLRVHSADGSHRLRVLDLFSGIGGFSVALQSIATTVAYCDVDPTCRAVLKRNMSRGLLDAAPVFEDVEALRGSDVQHLRPNMITAGFPCTDISVANPHGAGLRGERSGLFKEILRLVDELGTIDVLFLENSPHIVNKGFSTINRAMRKRGYQVRYCIAKALDVGAPHRRARWYCLCFKQGAYDRMLRGKSVDVGNPWNRCPTRAKVIAFKTKGERATCFTRCKMLGNSIVPQCAMHAWNCLLQGEGPACHVDTLYKKPPINIVCDDGKTVVQKEYWATPTFSVWHQYRSITHRGITILCNQLYYSRCNTAHAPESKPQHSHEYVCNPVFVEWMMGYPKDWTKTDLRGSSAR